MSEHMSNECSNITSSETSLHRILRNCVNFQSSESLLFEDSNDVSAGSLFDYYKMISTNSSYSTSGSISTNSYASDESFGENILEENGRISLAYENLRSIPRRIADKFAVHTKCLDLSYNNFQNLSFLSFFDSLHTLILDRNNRLNVSTLPFLSNLRILWINNCDIANVIEWIDRIQMQCPILEQLSIMGNPGIKANFNICTVNPNLLNEDREPLSVVSDYRAYILNALPDLEYLDGVARSTSLPPAYKKADANHNSYHHINGSNGKSLSAIATTKSIKPLNGNNISRTDSVALGINRRDDSSAVLSLRELFRIRRRKKSYQSSSTN